MKLLVVLSLIACGYAAKLDRTYLPPASAATAGGSPGSLNTPVGPSNSGGFRQPTGKAFGSVSSGAGFNQPAVNTGFGQPSVNGPAFGFQPSAPAGQYGAPSGGIDAGFGAVAQNFGAGAQNFGAAPQNYQRNQQSQRSQAAAEQNAEILRSDSQNDGETFSYSFETSNGITAEESGVATNGVQAQGAFSYSDDDGQKFSVTYTADENGYQPQGDHLPTPHPIPEDILKSIEKNAQAAAAGTQEGAYNPNEDNSLNGPQQYNFNAPNSYGQAPSGLNQQGPSQLYGAPNTGRQNAGRSGPEPQGFQPQGPTQLYDAPNAGSSRPSFGRSQTPPQNYGSPSNGAASHSNGFAQNQAPSKQYGAPNGLASNPSSNGFGPSGSAPQSGSSQYQKPQSRFPSAGRPQGRAQQPQDESGYQYDRPQESFRQAPNGRSQSPAGQFRPQNGAAQPSGPQNSFSRSEGGNVGYPTGRAQSFTPSSGPSSQGSFGPSGSGSFAPSSGSNAPNSFGPSSTSQGYNAPASQGPSSFGPSGSNAQSSFGPSSGRNGFGRTQGAGAGDAMADAGYPYNRPGSQPGAGSQGQGPQSRQLGNNGPRLGQNFGAPRQPPSFSEEEGYKY